MPPLLSPLHRRRLFLAVLGCIIFLIFSVGLPPARAADRVPVGVPQHLSPRDLLHYRRPAVAMDAGGNAVVVWQVGTEAPDIYAQLLDITGTPRSAPFRVHSTLTGSQRRPAVAMAEGGSFVVAWDGAGPGDAQGIWARRFTASGSPLGGDVLVNVATSGDQLNPAIAMQPNGAFAIVWEGAVPGDPAGVAFRRFTADAFPLDMADRLPDPASPPACSARSDPSIAWAASGALAVAWAAYRCDETTFAEMFSIDLQRYTAAGAAAGVRSLATAVNGAAVSAPAVAFDARDGMTAAWARSPLGDTQAVIEAMRLDAAGMPMSAPTVVSAATAAVRAHPQVAVDPEDVAVVAWADQSAPAGVPLGIAARLLNSDGTPMGDLLTPALPAATAPQTQHIALATARTVLNDLLFVWDSGSATPADPTGVYGRAYRSPGVVLNRAESVLREGETTDLRVALATAPATTVQIRLTPRDAGLRLANLAPGEPLTLTFTPETATLPQVITIAADDDALAGGVRTSLIDITTFSADPAYADAAVRIVIDGSLNRTLSFTILDNDGEPTPLPTDPALTPTPAPTTPTAPPAASPSPTAGPEAAPYQVFAPFVAE